MQNSVTDEKVVSVLKEILDYYGFGEIKELHKNSSKLGNKTGSETEIHFSCNGYSKEEEIIAFYRN